MGNSPSLPADVLLGGIVDMDLEQLRAIGEVNTLLRDLVKTTLHNRIYKLLTKFMDDDQISQFFSMLTITDSVIGGSVAQAVVTPSIFLKDAPGDLNIFVPEDFLDRWETFLHEEMGYYSLNIIVLEFGGEGKEGPPKIMVCEAFGSSSLVPILASPFSSQMNFVTEDHVYCLHPRLTPNLTAVEVPPPPGNKAKKKEQNAYIKKLRNRGVDVLDLDAQDKLCAEDTFCAAQLRFLGMKILARPKNAGDAVSMVCWNDDVNLDDFLAQKPLRFWMGGREEGYACKHAAHANRLLGV
ncbi:hypothetical protein GALMADRAFT_210830 [Galerina marginata CBS 339.88]|uniref:Uncharacterized protein n=1 Tax=Galerina marginata (strain CBS 339.88) TaxID=685588 RepID=A0A067SZ49_GALM3|nr:hypothetical protein GALMADRAFT_210830 [Galerina marginata CBS 339.88]